MSYNHYQLIQNFYIRWINCLIDGVIDMSLDYWIFGIIISVLVTLVITAINFTYKYGKWQGEVNTDRNTIKEFIKEIRKDKKETRKDIKETRKDIKEIFGRLPPLLTTSLSPIRLTELGDRISNNIDAEVWAKETAKDLIDKTKDMNSFEIQEESFKMAKNYQPTGQILKKIQNTAFQEGVKLEGIKEVLGVVLRDRLLAIHDKNKESLDS